MSARALPAFAALALLAAPAWADDPLRPLRELAVQDGGRVKPFDTFARETARRVGGARAFGAESIDRLDPALWLASAMADPERWKDAAIVRVANAAVRRAAGLPDGRDRYSLRELAGHAGFIEAAAAVERRLDADRGARLDPVEREIWDLYVDLTVFGGVLAGDLPRMVPHPGDPQAQWASLAALQREAAGGPASDAAGALLAAARGGDASALAGAARALDAALRDEAPGVYPAAGALGREVRYNRTKPFRTGWLLSLLAALFLMASFPLASRVLGAAGLTLLVVSFAAQTYGMALRTLISGRAPVTNMYETVVFVSWGAILFALLFEAAYRARWFAACAAWLSVLLLVLADSVPIMDGSIQPLVPVLRDNTWLTLHVLTIMLGYAAFFLAVALAHVNLGLFFFAPRRAVLLHDLTRFLYRALQAGTFFLAAGTLLGGVWASYSWGRFWGWDPKETWSLIALLTYLAVLHARFAGWIREFGLAVGALVGGLTVLMAWYGVNFILGIGLHAYGFGSGGTGYVLGFAAFEALVIVAAAVRRPRAGGGTMPAGAAVEGAR
jgi:ABC-type transport system involved in cytochrome c biogenesis permease subunit